ncbi:Ferredoxin--NADP reductase [Delftia tsuruhatensis]|uniref:NAD(P)/FAD-dependent oxidoreductase n=1 Tax=Delftia tsuruhatensis TaxID=180282 RepID=UPI001E6D453A|nr:NAD(P)/FAD-dependent oxidoreductase [Delftia tsuruhatensis]CAB5722670.1 Ferredoxin--NADP reductase [Delftia tsuruhatensis]CAC9680996.1 Ferredoxin--NADP reductase [Delftia tsuruhatensis]
MHDATDKHPIETDALVIGAGPAGLFQVFQLGLQGIRCHVVDALPHVGGQCAQLYGDKPIYDIPGIPVCTGHELVGMLQRQIAPMEARLHLSQQVARLLRLDDGRWQAETTEGLRLHARSVFIAAGVGAFVPKALKVPGVESLLPGQLHYHPASLEMARGKTVIVHGGDEEAVAAALAAADLAQTTCLLHRRDAFQASPLLLERLRALRDSGAIHVVIGQITQLQSDAGRLRAVQWMDGEGLEHELAAQQLVVCLGISPRLGPVAEWGLAMERKQLQVDPATLATDAPGIYAVGDIVTYPGKRKLILCGFHEATMAAFAAAEYLQGEKPLLQYTTTSARLHAILGVSHPDT